MTEGRNRTRDVAVLGGGATGLACALALAERGLAVTVLERDHGAEQAASRAAAGMLSSQLERHPDEAMAALCHLGRQRHVRFLAELAEETGDDLDHRGLGALRVARDEAELAELDALLAEQAARGWSASRLSRAEALGLEPMLGPCVAAAWFPEERVVDPPRLVGALGRACRRRGVLVRSGASVTAVTRRGAGGFDVALSDGSRLAAAEVVVAGGAWSSSIEGAGLEGAVRPIRGQILELRAGRVPSRILDAPGVYLSPRSDGRVLVGSTLEDVGFARGVTAGAARTLLEGALRLAPELASAELSRHWSGFRAATRDRLPLLGRSRTGVIAATGQFRNGIVLAAITADVVAALVTGAQPPVDLAPFRADRAFADG